MKLSIFINSLVISFVTEIFIVNIVMVVCFGKDMVMFCWQYIPFLYSAITWKRDEHQLAEHVDFLSLCSSNSTIRTSEVPGSNRDWKRTILRLS
jgi:hypothetical protein